jgi:hypothetical protein
LGKAKKLKAGILVISISVGIRPIKIAAWNGRKVTKADLEFERLTNGLTLGVEGQI